MIIPLSEMAVELMRATQATIDVLKIQQEQLSYLHKVVRDTAVLPDQEAAKRDLLDIWAQQLTTMEAGINALELGPVESKQLAREIADALMLRADALIASPDKTVEILTERANNIAAAYSGRVAKEPK